MNSGKERPLFASYQGSSLHLGLVVSDPPVREGVLGDAGAPLPQGLGLRGGVLGLGGRGAGQRVERGQWVVAEALAEGQLVQEVLDLGGAEVGQGALKEGESLNTFSFEWTTVDLPVPGTFSARPSSGTP